QGFEIDPVNPEPGGIRFPINFSFFAGLYRLFIRNKYSRNTGRRFWGCREIRLADGMTMDRKSVWIDGRLVSPDEGVHSGQKITIRRQEYV
ncbi:MAG TPA: hypothetical protein VK863_08800, partial [Candidatus Limnocylindrales bacterium]|nr:hypothetical protein [Candidatus Limnocylindrales bacterium]